MILRYLLNDNQAMADKTEKYLNAGDVYVTIEIMAEVVYVLKGVYSIERSEISYALKKFLELVNCHEMRVLSIALDMFAGHNLDFVDCVLYGYNRVYSAEIATFDKDLLKLLNA